MNLEQFQSPQFNEKVEKTLRRVIREHHIKGEKLDEQQIAEVFKQALACGDIQKLVVAGDGRQCVIYIPFAREQELEGKITELTRRVMELEAQLPTTTNHENID